MCNYFAIIYLFLLLKDSTWLHSHMQRLFIKREEKYNIREKWNFLSIKHVQTKKCSVFQDVK